MEISNENFNQILALKNSAYKRVFEDLIDIMTSYGDTSLIYAMCTPEGEEFKIDISCVSKPSN